MNPFAKLKLKIENANLHAPAFHAPFHVDWCATLISLHMQEAGATWMDLNVGCPIFGELWQFEQSELGVSLGGC